MFAGECVGVQGEWLEACLQEEWLGVELRGGGLLQE